MQKLIYIDMISVMSSANLPKQENDWLTVKEAAKQTGIPIPTLKRLCQKGKVPGAQQQPAPTAKGFYWLIPRASLDKIERKNVGRPKKEKS